MNRSRYPLRDSALGAGYTARGIRTPALFPLGARRSDGQTSPVSPLGER